MPPTPRLEIDPPESEAEGCIFERVEPSTSEILAPVKMKIGLGNETANTSAFPLSLTSPSDASRREVRSNFHL